MKVRSLGLFLVWLMGSLMLARGAFASSPDLLKAKKEAEAAGYTFIAAHHEIVEKAKREGKLRALSSMDRSIINALVPAFKKKYPFIDIYVEEVSGTEAGQRCHAPLAGIPGEPRRPGDHRQG